MAKKNVEKVSKHDDNFNGHIEGAGTVFEQPIVDTLRENYMPYAMSVIVSRAIPEIDGFKPSHRKLLYTMFTMGLLNGGRTKSANIVGQTMKLNPHGDQAIYDTMVRLSKGYAALLVPYVDSKGNFGKAYSRDMAWAASRYTEAKLDKICNAVFDDINKNAVDFVDNYDGTMKEPILLPVRFPSVLVNANTGIAVGMASNICSFNLREVCQTAIARIKDPNADLFETLPAPDFPGGAYILYNREELENVYRTGRGSVRVRSKWAYDKTENCIDITEIPPTTTVEAIMDKIVELVKANKIKSISDVRDETDLSGLKLTIDLKRGTDPEKLMGQLFKSTPLEDSFGANFNVLINGLPKVLGVGQLLDEWTDFRRGCVRRAIALELQQKKDKLHLLKGLKKILLDIDKAVKIVRETEEEKEVVPNLMIGFGIDEIQAEYVAEIKLRHLNREYILKRLEDIESLQADIEELESVLQNSKKLDKIIIEQLEEIANTYGQPRKSEILYNFEQATVEEEEVIEDYPVTLFYTKEGYFKKIRTQNLRLSGEQNLKDGDIVTQQLDTGNAVHLLFFTNFGQVYKARANDFADTKASVMGDFIATKLGMDSGEYPVYMAVTNDYKGYMLFFFENGKVAKVDLSCYETKQNRKKLLNAYNTKDSLISCICITEDRKFILTSSSSKMLIFDSSMLTSKTTKNTQGVSVMTLKKKARIINAQPYEMGTMEDEHRLMTRNIPAAGGTVKDLQTGEQLSL